MTRPLARRSRPIIVSSPGFGAVFWLLSCAQLSNGLGVAGHPRCAVRSRCLGRRKQAKPPPLLDGDMLEIRNLVKNFGPLVAVDNVSFSVPAGEVLGFLGPNGAGKSTTMKMITGFLAPSAGTAVVCGYDVTEEPIAVKRKIGYLPEGAPPYADMPPSAFLDFIARIRAFSGAEARKRVALAVERVALGEVLYQPIDTLSQGFRRRGGLAQALLHDPEILILDEPTDGLDPNQKHEVRRLISELAPGK